MRQVLCSALGHRYRYVEVIGAQPGWVCRRCRDRQDTRPPVQRPQWVGLGGWGGV